MPARNAAERVRARVREWFEREGHGSKKQLAEAVGAKYGDHKSYSWITSIQKPREGKGKGQDIRLADLDDVAEAIGMPPGELVCQDGRKYLEVTMAESRLIEYYRGLPDVIRASYIRVLDYLFAFHKDGPKSTDTKTRTRRREPNPPMRDAG